jgi:hypothetical protein
MFTLFKHFHGTDKCHTFGTATLKNQIILHVFFLAGVL